MTLTSTRGRVGQGKRGDRSRGGIGCKSRPRKFENEVKMDGMLSLPGDVDRREGYSVMENGNAEAEKISGRKVGFEFG